MSRSWQKIPNLRERIKALPTAGSVQIRADEWPIVGRKPCMYCQQDSVIYRGKQDLVHYCQSHGRLTTRMIEQQRLLLEHCEEPSALSTQPVSIINNDSPHTRADNVDDNQHKQAAAVAETVAALGADSQQPKVTRQSVLAWLMSLPIG